MLYGGFAFYGDGICAILAVTTRESKTRIQFGKPITLKLTSIEPSRLQEIVSPYFLRQGAAKFCWLSPGEQVSGLEGHCHDGAFAYLMEDESSLLAFPVVPAPKWILQRVFGYFPLHLLVLLIFSPMFLFSDVTFNGWPTAIWHGFLSAGMLQAWFPMHAEVWNAPTWFLSALTFAMAALPFALPVLAKQSKAQLRRTGLVLFLVGLLPKLGYCYDFQAWGMLEGAMSPKALPNLAMFNMQRFSPFYALIEVLLGAVACRMVMLDGAEGEEKAPKTNVLSTALPLLGMEEVAMAAAADTTARIRAAAERALAPARGGAVSAAQAAPWALVPMAPMYSWQPCVPMMPSMGLGSMGSFGSMASQNEKKHREELQHELADLRSRFQELQDSYNQLEKENHQLKNMPGTGGKLDETCRRQEQDIIHLKRALKEREEGEASLRRLFAEEQALSRNVLRENERLKHELRRFAKAGEKLELQVKGRQKDEVMQVVNSTKSKLWYCGFCGESTVPRSIAKHLAKPQSLGKRGSCSEVTVEALREVMCFCAADDAELAEQKIQEITGGGTKAEPKAEPKEPKEAKSKGKRSSEAPKESPKRAKAKAAPKSPEKKRAKESEKKAEDRSDVRSEKKGKKEKNEKNEKNEKQTEKNEKDEILRKEPQEENPRDPRDSKESKDADPESGKKRKEVVVATSPAKKGKTGKEAKPKVDVEAEAVHKHNASDHDDDMEQEEVVDEVCLGIDGLQDWELPNIPEVGLVASASAVAETLLLNLELKSDELTEVVQLQGDQSEFLTKKFGTSSWSSLIAAAADATLEVHWDSVTITAESPRARMIAAMLRGTVGRCCKGVELLSYALEFHSNGGIIVSEGPMHPLITVVKLGALPHSYLEWFAELGEAHQVCIIPARLAGSLKLVKGASVQVQERDRWISAEITQEPFMGVARY
eukprot:s2789_g4.t1